MLARGIFSRLSHLSSQYLHARKMRRTAPSSSKSTKQRKRLKVKDDEYQGVENETSLAMFGFLYSLILVLLGL